MANLGSLKPRQSGRVISVSTGSPHVDRLLAMGVIPGTVVNVVGLAPLGDPMMVDVNGCRMSLRRREAEALTVEPTGASA
jgi:Fe2+ transport system protein FeoA